MTPSKKVLLFIPNTRWFEKRPWLLIPHSALILTRILKPLFNFSILDANAEDLNEAQCVEQLKESAADYVLSSGVSVEYFQQYHKSFELIKQALPSSVTIFGGIYPTLLGEEALDDDHIDYIYAGPAEEQFPDFLRLLMAGHTEEAKKVEGIGYRNADGSKHLNERKSVFSTNMMAIDPDYSLINTRKYLQQNTKDYNFNFKEATGILLTSYGCKYNCVFCAARTIRGRTILFRSAESVLSEIEFLIREYGVRHLSFLDECFLGDRERAVTILKAFIDRGYKLTWKMPNVSAWHLDDELLELMKASGCTMITVSVESGSERVLHRIVHKPCKLDIFPPIVKKCRELGIDTAANFVIGLPGETWDEIRQTFRVAEAFNFDLCAFHIATPYPGTDLYTIAKKEGLLPPDFGFKNPKYYGTSHGFITTSEFTPMELMILRAFEWDRINFSTPEKITKIAGLMNMTEEQLTEHRKQTRLKCGVHY